MSDALILIDTSVWILALRKSPLQFAKERVDLLLRASRVATTPIIRLELLGGTKSTDEFARLKSRLEALHQMPIGDEEWEEAAQIAFHLGRRGKTIPYTDILIASIAIRGNALLLHADKHFDIMAGETGLAVESIISMV